MKDTEFSFWITPAQPLKTRLAAVIKKLADQFAAVDFMPHVTVCSGRSSDTEARAIATQIIAKFPPIHLVARKLSYSNLFTQTLFVEFDDSPILTEMTDHIRRRFSQPSRFVLQPHLSLLYQNLAEEQQLRLCRDLQVGLGGYLFDAIRVIETEVPVEDREPIERWRPVFRARLGGPAQ